MSENKVNVKDRLNISKRIDDNATLVKDLTDKVARLNNLLDKIKTEYNEKKAAYEAAILEKTREEARKKQLEAAAKRLRRR